MNLKFNSLFIFIFILTFVSCKQNNFIETNSGLKYKMVRKVRGGKFKNGHYLYLNMDYYNEDDSLLFTYRDEGIPVTVQYFDTIWVYRGQIYEGLKKMSVGDSAIFKVNCENLYNVSFRGPIPAGIDPNSEITFYVGVENMSTPEEFRFWQANLYIKSQEELERRQADQLIEDIAKIDEYMDMNGLIPMELESGLRYIVVQEGKGQNPESGDKVTIHYTGKLLDGSNIDSSFDQGAPIEFVLGRGLVIKGWEEGIPLLNEGSKYTFYIPSTLAYGEDGLSDIIKPNSVLVYEIELLEIQKTED